MKIREIILESKKTEAPKPRNFVAKHAKTSGAGAHKDKKKSQKQGETKHKGKVGMDEAFGQRNSYGYNPDRDAEKEWDAARRAEKDFRNRERSAGEEEPQGWFDVLAKSKDGWKVLGSKRSNEAFRYASNLANKYPDRKFAVRWPDGTINVIPKHSVGESATAGATSSANVGTVVSPHLAIGKDRGKKSYTGSPGRSGTKAPRVPKAVQDKNPDGTAKNALDIKNNIFGGGALKR